MPILYLEDLAAGQVYRSAELMVETKDIKLFASQFDPQPFHLDETAARNSIFGGLAASGWHTAAMTMRLMVGSNFKLAGGLIGAGVEELRWPRPVRPGDRLRVQIDVLEVRPSQSKHDRGVIKARITTSNQNGEPVQIFAGNMIVFRRP
jgi:acyl dehydratase